MVNEWNFPERDALYLELLCPYDTRDASWTLSTCYLPGEGGGGQSDDGVDRHVITIPVPRPEKKRGRWTCLIVNDTSALDRICTIFDNWDDPPFWKVGGHFGSNFLWKTILLTNLFSVRSDEDFAADIFSEHETAIKVSCAEEKFVCCVVWWPITATESVRFSTFFFCERRRRWPFWKKNVEMFSRLLMGEIVNFFPFQRPKTK